NHKSFLGEYVVGSCQVSSVEARQLHPKQVKPFILGNYPLSRRADAYMTPTSTCSNKDMRLSIIVFAPGEPVPLLKGETVIKPKVKKAVKEPSVDVEQKESSSQEETPAKQKDRVQQRENRKKEQKMSLDEKKRTLFVGNAPLSMDERSCRKLFAQYGPIESVRMRSVVPAKQTITKRIAHIAHEFHEKLNSLNFYIKFKDEESVKKALTYNGTILERHRIRVDTCTTKAEYDRNLTVFGNLPLDVKDDELAEFFEENVGGVSFVRCIRDSSSGMGKGIAFVVFKVSSSFRDCYIDSYLH
ncbi:hypothetical protein COOONC_16667, partial [Cooperia oncophora]